jgi:uncharacterized protein YggE
LALLTVSLVACTAVQAAPVETKAQDAPPAPETPRTITVVGVGKISLVPDVARINVGTEVRAETVSEAKDKVDTQMAAITAALKEFGIEDKDIQTNHYSIHYEREVRPVMGEGPPAPERIGYRVSSMLRVTVRDVEHAGQVLDAVVEAGANQVYGVEFTVSDEAEWEGQARKKAIANATERAEELAGLTGIERGEVLAVSEVIGGMWSMPMRVMGIGGGGGGGFAPGELEMSTQVQVIFAFKLLLGEIARAPGLEPGVRRGWSYADGDSGRGFLEGGAQMSHLDRDERVIYQIRVRGVLDAEWSDWFGEMIVSPQANGDTVLAGPVRDQCALHGILNKIRDLGLPLLSLTRSEACSEQESFARGAKCSGCTPDKGGIYVS